MERFGVYCTVAVRLLLLAVALVAGVSLILTGVFGKNITAASRGLSMVFGGILLFVVTREGQINLGDC